MICIGLTVKPPCQSVLIIIPVPDGALVGQYTTISVLSRLHHGGQSPHWTSRASSKQSLEWKIKLKDCRWVQKVARPISLRQLTVFGRSLTESRLISSANYVRNELPTRFVTCSSSDAKYNEVIDGC